MVCQFLLKTTKERKLGSYIIYGFNDNVYLYYDAVFAILGILYQNQLG